MKDLTDGSITKYITLQACFSLWLVRSKFRRRLALPAASNV
jgi:hypothetical protein